MLSKSEGGSEVSGQILTDFEDMVSSKVLGIGITIMTNVDPYLVFCIICSFTFVLEEARSVIA